MNICYINMNRGLRGGVETVTEALAEELVIRKHNVFIICDRMGQNQEYREHRTFKTREIPCENIDSEQNMIFIADFFEKNKIDIVILQLYLESTTCLILKSIEFIKTRKIKLISCLHSCLIIETNTAKGFKYYIAKFFKSLYLAKKIYYVKKRLCAIHDKSDLLVFLSQRFCEQLKNFVPKKKLDKLRFVPNPLTFSQNAVDITKKKKQILFVGRFHEAQKRISLLLKIWEKLVKFECCNDWRLKLVGSGMDEEVAKVKMQAKNLPRVDFEGWQEPKNYYLDSSIFLMTSIHEGLPMTLLESSQFGCVPVVMDSFLSVRDIVSDGENGFITPNNDVNAFTEKVCLLMDNQDLRESMAKNGMESAKKIFNRKYYAAMGKFV